MIQKANSNCFSFNFNIYDDIFTINYLIHMSFYIIFIALRQKMEIFEFKPKLSFPIILIFFLIINASCVKMSGLGQTFKDDYHYSNMIVTSKYVLIGKNNQQQPTLKKLSFQTMELETIVYEKVDDWRNLYLTNLVDLQNGDIAFGVGYHVFVLNNQTLEIKQAISKRFSPNDQIGDIKSFIDPNTNQSVYFIGRGTYGALYSEIKKNENGEYIPQYRFATPSYMGPMTLTSINSAVSITYCDISYWTNLYSVVDRQIDLKYFMKSRLQVAVSYDEKFFVLRNDTGFYEFYTLDEKYDVKLTSDIFISYNDYRKGMLIDDDKYLFVSLSNPRDKHNIAKVDISKGEFTYAIDSDGSSDNQMDFTLFSSQFNRFITLASKNKNYYLQLRSVDSMQLMHELLLHFDFPVLEYKLVGDAEWGLTFALGVRKLPYSSDLEKDSTIFIFSIQGDKITKLNISPADVSFSFLKASFKYIVSYKARFPTINIYHFSNLTLAGEIQTGSQYEVRILIEKSIMMLQDNIFNMESSFSSKGWFFKVPNTDSGPILSMIFKKRGVIYCAPTYASSSFTVPKTIYNISSPTVTSLKAIDPTNSISCNSPIYYINPKNYKNICNFVFYIEYDNSAYTKHPQIVRYDECSQAKLKYPIEYFTEEVRVKLYMSSDKKYIIAIVNQWAGDRHLIQIRLIDKFDKIIYHQVINIEREPSQYPLDGYYMDLVNGTTLLLKTNRFVQVTNINEKMNKVHFEI